MEVGCLTVCEVIVDQLLCPAYWEQLGFSRPPSVHSLQNDDSVATLQQMYVRHDAETQKPGSGGAEDVDDASSAFIVSSGVVNACDKYQCTPLLLACQRARVDLVRCLLRHPGCNRDAADGDGNTPLAVIGQRLVSCPLRAKQDITAALEARYYVPLWRAEDNTLSPHVGTILDGNQTPPLVGQPSACDAESPARDNAAASPLDGRADQQRSPLSPTFRVAAVAGPMPRGKAADFRREWQTSHFSKTSPLKRVLHAKVTDAEKGSERVGRLLAARFHVPWHEMWQLADGPCDLDANDDAVFARLERCLRDAPFLGGRCPAKVDRQIFQALNEAGIADPTVLRASYPHCSQWLDRMQGQCRDADPVPAARGNDDTREDRTRMNLNDRFMELSLHAHDDDTESR